MASQKQREQKQQEPSAAVARCPNCREPTHASYRPFCSARCRDVDLSRWLRGTYAIPGGQAEADEDGEDAAARHAGARSTESGDDSKDGRD
jgi:endogenous inhibitor of DNA gyrase (YacG/DUF329 family)